MPRTRKHVPVFVSAKKKGKRLNKTQKREVKLIVSKNLETKFFQAGQDNQSAIASGSLFSLSQMTQGVTDVTRTGDTIHLRSLQLRMKLVASAGGLLASADAWNEFRVIVFRWRENDGAIVPVVANILTNGGTSTDLTIAPINEDQKHLFEILYDKNHLVFNQPTYNGSAIAVEPGQGHVKNLILNFYGKKLGPKMIRYINNGPNSQGAIYVLVVSDSAFTPNPKYSYQSIMKYQDA